MANVDIVEVLKGPSAIMYGRIEPGGVVNVVTKRPIGDWRLSAQVLTDNFGTSRPSLDFNGPFDASRSLLFRLNAAYDDAKSVRDFSTSRTSFVAPALTWTLAKKTVLSL